MSLRDDPSESPVSACLESSGGRGDPRAVASSDPNETAREHEKRAEVKHREGKSAVQARPEPPCDPQSPTDCKSDLAPDALSEVRPGSGAASPPYLDTQGNRSDGPGISLAESLLALEVQRSYRLAQLAIEADHCPEALQIELASAFEPCLSPVPPSAPRPELDEVAARAAAKIRARDEWQRTKEEVKRAAREAETAGVQEAVGPRGTKPTYKRRKGRHGKEYVARSKLARPVIRDIFRWRSEFAEALRSIGDSFPKYSQERGAWRLRAARAEQCASQALTWDCPSDSCGEKNARSIVLASCGLRACPWCARRSAEKRRERLAKAWALVPVAVEKIREERLAKLREEEREEARKVAKWSDLAQRARKKSARAVAAGRDGAALRAEELAERHETRALNAEDRRSLAAFGKYRLGERYWSPKLITIGEPWTPENEEECSVEGLRRRAVSVLNRWSKLWEKIGCDGVASAIVQVELSADGFVHLHALFYGAFLVASHAAELCGAFVHVREADGPTSFDAPLLSKPACERTELEELRIAAQSAALDEALKYPIKAPTVLSSRVATGAKIEIVNPRLAANWCAATDALQLGRLYGLVRTLAPEEPEGEEEPDEIAPGSCPTCGTALEKAAHRVVVTRELARELGPLWSARACVRRQRE